MKTKVIYCMSHATTTIAIHVEFLEGAFVLSVCFSPSWGFFRNRDASKAFKSLGGDFIGNSKSVPLTYRLASKRQDLFMYGAPLNK